MVEGLSQGDPAGRPYYTKRGLGVVESYKDVHQWALKRIAGIPKKQRFLLTSQDAFNYFGKSFGFQVLAVQ